MLVVEGGTGAGADITVCNGVLGANAAAVKFGACGAKATAKARLFIPEVVLEDTGCGVVANGFFERFF